MERCRVKQQEQKLGNMASGRNPRLTHKVTPKSFDPQYMQGELITKACSSLTLFAAVSKNIVLEMPISILFLVQVLKAFQGHNGKISHQGLGELWQMETLQLVW